MEACLTVSLHETDVCSPRSRRKVASHIHADPEIPGFIRESENFFCCVVTLSREQGEQ